MNIVPTISVQKHPHLVHAINNISSKKERFLIANNLEKFYKGKINAKEMQANRPEGSSHWNAVDTINSIFVDDKTVPLNCNLLAFQKRKDETVHQRPTYVMEEMFALNALKWLKYINNYLLTPLGFHLEMYDGTVIHGAKTFFVHFIRIEHGKVCATFRNNVVLKEFDYVYDIKPKMELYHKKYQQHIQDEIEHDKELWDSVMESDDD